MYQTLKGFNYMICCRWSNCRRCCRLIRQLLPHLSSPQAYQVPKRCICCCTHHPFTTTSTAAIVVAAAAGIAADQKLN